MKPICYIESAFTAFQGKLLLSCIIPSDAMDAPCNAVLLTH